MTHVVTDNCTKCRFTECVTVCPVDCFHVGSDRLYIDPDVCIDCGACVPMCPVESIYDEIDLPADQEHWLAENREQAPALPVQRTQLEPLPGAEERQKELGF